MRASGDPAGRSIQALGGLRGKRKKARKGRKKTHAGSFCVYSKNDKLINCFQSEATAKKFAKGALGGGAYVAGRKAKKAAKKARKGRRKAR